MKETHTWITNTCELCGYELEYGELKCDDEGKMMICEECEQKNKNLTQSQSHS